MKILKSAIFHCMVFLSPQQMHYFVKQNKMLLILICLCAIGPTMVIILQCKSIEDFLKICRYSIFLFFYCEIFLNSIFAIPVILHPSNSLVILHSSNRHKVENPCESLHMNAPLVPSIVYNLSRLK